MEDASAGIRALLVFCLMALLYLAGDNLEQMVCEPNLEGCLITGQVLTGASLILNILLTLLRASGTKPKTPSAFPVVGIMGSVYDKMLQIAASALTIDQTVTTILKSVPGMSRIEGESMANTAVNTTINENTVLNLSSASGIMTALCGLVVLLLAVLVIQCYSNRSVCCNDCECDCGCLEWCEMCGQWLCATCVVSFVALFVVGDIIWIWNFFNTDTVSQPASIVRLTILVASSFHYSFFQWYTYL